MRGVSRALRAGGGFFLDARVAETLYPRFRARDWYTWGEGDARRLVLEDRRLDHERGRIESTWTVVHGGRERTEHVSMRIYAFSELRRMLEAAGFATLRAFDGAERGVQASGADRLWLVAEKPGSSYSCSKPRACAARRAAIRRWPSRSARRRSTSSRRGTQASALRRRGAWA